MVKKIIDPSNLLYFAYGSNMSENRMKKRGIVYTKRYPGKLLDHRLVFNTVSRKNPSVSFANIVPSKGDVVEGVIYDIGTIQSNLDILDRVEGNNVHYKRSLCKIEVNENESVIAITYVAMDNMIVEGLKPTTEYLSYLLEGKDCLSEEYFNDLKFNTL